MGSHDGEDRLNARGGVSFGFTGKDQSPQDAARRFISSKVTVSRSIIRSMYRIHHNSCQDRPAHPVVTLAIDEHHGRTYAKAELQWGGAHLAGVGVAYRHPADYLVSEAGQELATARALSDLADQLTALCRVGA